MRFEVLTIFPNLFGSFRETGLLGKAVEGRLIDIDITNIRDFAADKHKTVDDTPYGGGAGMVMKIEPIDRSLAAIKESRINPPSRKATGGHGNQESSNQQRVVVLSARGKQFTQIKAQEYAKLDELVLVCGRYEGVDQRVADYLADEELSIGPYVLNGGEVAAMAIIEAVARLVPGVVGNPESLKEESYGVEIQNQKNEDSKQIRNSKFEIRNSVECPQYTKPAEYKGWKVPEVLLSGNHDRIKKWREKNSN